MNRPRILHAVSRGVFNLGGVGKVVQSMVEDLSGRYQFSVAAEDAEVAGAPELITGRLEKRMNTCCCSPRRSGCEIKSSLRAWCGMI